MTATVFGFLFIAVGIFSLFYPLFNFVQNIALPLISGAAVIIAGIVLWLDTTRIKVIIDDDSVELQHAFSRSRLLLAEIEGYRKIKSDIYLVSKTGTALRIPSGLEGINSLKNWIEENYKDADELHIATETTDILANEQFGFTKEDRELTLRKAKTVSRVGIFFGVVILLWLWLYPKPYELVWALVLLLPFAGIIILWRFKGLVTINGDKKSAYPSVQFVFIISGFAVIVPASHYDLYQYTNLWAPIAVITLILSIIVYSIAFTGSQVTVNKKPAFIAIVLLFIVYGFGATVYVNCHYDKSQAQNYTVRVLGKYATHGKSTTYNITVSAWGRFTEDKNITVSRSDYNNMQFGDTVHIYLYQGKLGIPWYYLDKN